MQRLKILKGRQTIFLKSRKILTNQEFVERHRLGKTLAIFAYSAKVGVFFWNIEKFRMTPPWS